MSVYLHQYVGSLGTWCSQVRPACWENRTVSDARCCVKFNTQVRPRIKRCAHWSGRRAVLQHDNASWLDMRFLSCSKECGLMFALPRSWVNMRVFIQAITCGKYGACGIGKPCDRLSLYTIFDYSLTEAVSECRLKTRRIVVASSTRIVPMSTPLHLRYAQSGSSRSHINGGLGSIHDYYFGKWLSVWSAVWNRQQVLGLLGWYLVSLFPNSLCVLLFPLIFLYLSVALFVSVLALHVSRILLHVEYFPLYLPVYTILCNCSGYFLIFSYCTVNPVKAFLACTWLLEINWIYEICTG